MNFQPCAIIPSRNHHLAMGGIVDHLVAAGMPVFIIDDASDEPARTRLAQLADAARGVRLYRFPTRQGKGGAVVKGFELGREAGFTHALQIDADGQHDLAAAASFLERGRANPEAVILGQPVYDTSIPFIRRWGRWLTHLLVMIETLSPRFLDSMCGFRLYPLAAVASLLATERVGTRMDFDTEILVRLLWRGVKPVTLPVRVTYPPGNLSNFHPLSDNWRMTRMHVRLLWGRLTRGIVKGNGEQPQHWARLAERGAYGGLRLLALLYRVIGYRGVLALLAPLVLYFYLTGPAQARASHRYLERVARARGECGTPGAIAGLRHAFAFARNVVDTCLAWIGEIDEGVIAGEDLAEVRRVVARGTGIVLVVSHLGTIELTRATLGPELRARIAVLMHAAPGGHFRR
ncbi:MAG TPA: glycosyltransferase, partial [Stellaceae bacterium]|nr:glycosyltransferase [Stellaceae bacterium]